MCSPGKREPSEMMREFETSTFRLEDIVDQKAIVIATMKPESRDLLDHMMLEWQAVQLKSKEMGLPYIAEDSTEDSAVYRFAYWLTRYSGILDSE
jgi:hypothetical protein